MRKVCFIDAIGHVKERCHAKFLEGHLNELGLLIGQNKSGSFLDVTFVILEGVVIFTYPYLIY